MKKNLSATTTKATSKKLQFERQSPKFSNTIEKQKKENQSAYSNVNMNSHNAFMIPNSLLSSISREEDLQLSTMQKFSSKEILGDTTQTYYGSNSSVLSIIFRYYRK